MLVLPGKFHTTQPILYRNVSMFVIKNDLGTYFSGFRAHKHPMSGEMLRPIWSMDNAILIRPDYINEVEKDILKTHTGTTIHICEVSITHLRSVDVQQDTIKS